MWGGWGVGGGVILPSLFETIPQRQQCEISSGFTYVLNLQRVPVLCFEFHHTAIQGHAPATAKDVKLNRRFIAGC